MQTPGLAQGRCLNKGTRRPLLVLLDVQSAFDGLPHQVVIHALDALGVSGRMEQFVRAFLTGRSFRVRMGTVQSSPQPVTAGVPQGSVLSPFLFNVALARLPSSIPKGRRFPVHCSVYADDIALWTSGPRRSLPAVRTCLQEALDASVGHLASVGLTVSSAKTKDSPGASSTDLLHPARNPSQVFKVVLGYLADTMLADRL
ncbi:hypothetical protein HPB49_005863 [Dermacentor silvarum]|uniref:Uncharacterized protein n=1 Tax=Dermacentor silvarum TaxID=543639 RepID=A0ACB8CVN7_DERSI|nr:hypothetical protein HPB49_005863 [Dermacentor silvarum]